ncbi:hypothetical protein E4V27_06650 [Proteus mirabilis]|nr:hypothetical protein E4V27_06650 [Proteus mirabilis]
MNYFLQKVRILPIEKKDYPRVRISKIFYLKWQIPNGAISLTICGVSVMNKKLIIIALLVNTAISLLTLSGVGYLYVNSPKFVSFDIKSTTDTFLNQVAKLNLSEEEQTALMKKYERSINNIINEYDKDGKIVFVKGAVISQLSDETQEIKAKLAKKMRGGNDE